MGRMIVDAIDMDVPQLLKPIEEHLETCAGILVPCRLSMVVSTNSLASRIMLSFSAWMRGPALTTIASNEHEQPER